MSQKMGWLDCRAVEPTAAASVSVVISTYNRCESCKRAVASVFEQHTQALEVLVCDDGSTDSTRAEFERWQEAEPRLRYLRLPSNHGMPAAARNLGVALAQGDWIAFLDDDDRWLPEKLASQAPSLTNDVDVVATDAIRSSGGRYFGAGAIIASPCRAEIERVNPIIMSSAVVRRSLALDVNGFYEIPAVEDYDLWLRLADRGARFKILDVASVEYRDHGDDRFGSARLDGQRALLRMRMRRLRLAPWDCLVLRSALRECAITARMSVKALLGRVGVRRLGRRHRR